MITITVENSDKETEKRRFVSPQFAKKFIAHVKKAGKFKVTNISGDGAEDLKKKAGIA